MGFNLVMITTGSRPRLLEQSLRSLRENATSWVDHQLTVVMDGCSVFDACENAATVPDRVIINPERQGASHSRNIGASSTPKYLRKDAVMFLDDDVYMCKGWDSQLAGLRLRFAASLLSSHAHPYNSTVLCNLEGAIITNVLSTVHFVIPWDKWDQVGYWIEPGGPGGSEDVEYCKRAAHLRCIIGQPHHVLHTGVGSTSGSKLIGWEHVMDNNRRLERLHGITGQVKYE